MAAVVPGLYRGGGGANFVRGLFRPGNFRRGEFSPPLQIAKGECLHCALLLN